MMLLSMAIRWLTTAETFSGRALIFSPPEMRSAACEVCMRYLWDFEVLARCIARALAAILDLADALMESRRNVDISGEYSAAHWRVVKNAVEGLVFCKM